MSVFCLRICAIASTAFLLLASSSSQSAEKNSVGLEQMKLASSIGAQCSGFYDGVFALLHNMETKGDDESLAIIKSHWSGVNKRYVFRQSTSAMLMTDIFIKQMNQKFVPEKSFSMQSFTQDYVNSRKSAMAWKDQPVANAVQKQQRDQCDHILQITKRNGTLREEVINNAMEKRSEALGIDLKKID